MGRIDAVMLAFGSIGLALLLGGCAAGTSKPRGWVRVAACQILVDGNRDAALRRIESALDEASAQGAQVACFPEACLLGWLNPEAHRLADAIPGTTTKKLGELARRFGMMLSVGLAERDGSKLHNSVVLIGRDGELLAKHRKVNVLPGLMEPGYDRGDGHACVVETEYGRVGLLICADTFEDDLVHGVAELEPDLVLVPYGWAAPEEDWPGHGESLGAWIRHTAQLTRAPVVGVDSCGALAHGPWSGFLLGGQSRFSGADGRLSAPMADRLEEVRVFDVWTGEGDEPVGP